MINTLKDVVEIEGKAIRFVDQDMGIPIPNYLCGDTPIVVDHNVDMIAFKMLTKPASEGGNLDLCQWSDLVAVGLTQLQYLNEKFPCRENAMAITKIQEGLMWNEQRTKNRINRGVEGKNVQ